MAHDGHGHPHPALPREGGGDKERVITHSPDAHGKDAHGAQSTVSAYSPSEEARRRWWSMPFDATTNFSLLGFFLGWIMDRNDKNVDLRL